jgi:signal transduction histidine kinase
MREATSDPFERVRREEDALQRVVEEISSELELRPLLTRIVTHACDLLDAHDGSIGLYDTAHEVMRIEAVCRMPPQELGMEYAAGAGLAGTVLARGQPVLVSRYGDLPGATLPELAENAVVGVPIHGRSELIGFFGIGARPPRVFDERDLGTLTLFARHAAIAIDNAMRYRREQARSERMELIARVSRLVSAGLEPAELVATAAQVIHEQLGYPNVVIPLLERGPPEQLVYRAHAGAYRDIFREEYRLPVTRGITGAAVRDRAVQVVNDVSRDLRYVPAPQPIDVTCELAVPILRGNEVFGVINIEGRKPFEEEDVSSIKIIADHLAVAIKNAQLSEAAREAAVMRERQRLARDLHDAVSQVLSSISLISQSLVPAWAKDPAEGERRARRLEELSRLAFAEMRALLHELQPVQSSGANGTGESASPLDEVRRSGLKEALGSLMAVMAPKGIEVRFEFERYPPQSLAHEEALFRICQEAGTNAVRHGHARNIVVRAEAPDDAHVRVEVRDDGCGFDARPSRMRRNGNSGFGLGNIRERARALGGSARIESEPGRGTRVVIELPRRDR